MNTFYFAPAFGIGFLHGLKISERALQPSETRSAFKEKIMKLFLFFLVIGGLFSSVNFALHGGAMIPDSSLVDDGIVPWATEMITANGGATFLIVSSITIMAAAHTKNCWVKWWNAWKNYYILVEPSSSFQ